MVLPISLLFEQNLPPFRALSIIRQCLPRTRHISISVAVDCGAVVSSTHITDMNRKNEESTKSGSGMSNMRRLPRGHEGVSLRCRISFALQRSCTVSVCLRLRGSRTLFGKYQQRIDQQELPPHWRFLSLRQGSQTSHTLVLCTVCCSCAMSLRSCAGFVARFLAVIIMT